MIPHQCPLIRLVMCGFLSGMFFLSVAYADRVVPGDSVQSHVNVRRSPSAESERIGVLTPGGHLKYIDSLPGWHRVRLEDGRLGHVSDSWAEVKADPEEKPLPADIVVPKDTVRSFVNVRHAPSYDSERVGRLLPGEQLGYIGSLPGWHKVALAGGEAGFISKRWTTVRPAPVDRSAVSPFRVHFLDVGAGDSVIIDRGSSELIIDGGGSVAVLSEYARRTGIIDDPVELIVLTHGHDGQWKGLSRLLGLDGVEDVPFHVREFWEPGYNRDCDSAESSERAGYIKFISAAQSLIPAEQFLRPLEHHHTPASMTGRAEPIRLPFIPGVSMTLLHTDSSPAGSTCQDKIDNSSIVLMVEVDGIRFLFPGDAGGKYRGDSHFRAPRYVEAGLLELEADDPGLLRADVLKVPSHGDETSSTQGFIDAVNPKFAIISATPGRHLPEDTVLERFRERQGVVLSTGVNRGSNQDHIICAKIGVTVDCNYEDVF